MKPTWREVILAALAVSFIVGMYWTPVFTCIIAGRLPTAASLIPYLFGYAFSILGPWMPPWRIGAISERLWTGLGGAQVNQEKRLPTMVGVVERGLYTTSYLLGKPDFVGAWLLLKVAGAWKGWTTGHAGVGGRALYQTFTIGTGLSLAYGIVGALVIEWLQSGLVVRATVASGFLLCTNVALWLWALLAFSSATVSHPTPSALGPDEPTPDEIREMEKHVDHEMERLLRIGNVLRHHRDTLSDAAARAMRVAFAGHTRALLEFFYDGRPGKTGKRRRKDGDIDVWIRDYATGYSTGAWKADHEARFRDADKLVAHLTTGRLSRGSLNEWGSRADRQLVRAVIQAIILAVNGTKFPLTSAALAEIEPD